MFEKYYLKTVSKIDNKDGVKKLLYRHFKKAKIFISSKQKIKLLKILQGEYEEISQNQVQYIGLEVSGYFLKCDMYTDSKDPIREDGTNQSIYTISFVDFLVTIYGNNIQVFYTKPKPYLIRMLNFYKKVFCEHFLLKPLKNK